MKSYLEISITATKSQRELLIPTMIELGCRGFMETDDELINYFETTDSTHQQIDKLKTDIRQLLRTISSNADIKMKTIQEENWNAQWEQTIQPIEIGERLVVKPSWSTYQNNTGKIVLQIDPKMSFGTGYHESTRLILRLLEKYLVAGCSLLDVGTGTGILAIAAVKLGAARAIGIDNDNWSIENARENVQANQVDASVHITDTPLYRIREKEFDIISANITLNTVIELLPEMIYRLKHGGVLLLSGLLIQDETILRNELQRLGFGEIEKLSENEWIALSARRR